MKQILVLVFTLGLSLPASAQTFDLHQLELGTVVPLVLELDGDDSTTEWAVLSNLGIYIVNPATGCKAEITYHYPQDPYNTHYAWFYSILRVNGRDHMFMFDVDARDQRLPSIVKPISSKCYPESLLGTEGHGPPPIRRRSGR